MTDTHLSGPVAHASNHGHTIHGVAIGEGDVTAGEHGRKRWPRETLEPAAESLTGEPFVYNAGDPSSHDGPGRRQVGEVVRAGYEPGVGVVYEANISDSDVAEQLARGDLEVSIEGTAEEADTDPDTGAAILRDFEFTGIAAVKRGASPSNYAAPGDADTNPGIAALSAGDIRAVLQPDLSPAVKECEKSIRADNPGMSKGEAIAICRAQNATALAEIEGTEVDLSPSSLMVASAEAAADAGSAGLIPGDCGTGVGDRRRQQILDAGENGELAGETWREIASYLTSHEGDTTTDDPPSQWGEDLWSDGCGNAQQAKWGWDVEYAQRRVNDIDRAQDADPTYPEVANARMAEHNTEKMAAVPLPTEAQLLYPTEDMAGSVAEAMGLAESHSHDLDGETWHMPGESHEAFTEAMDRMAVDMSGHKDEEMADAEDAATADIDDLSSGTLVRWGSGGDRPAYGEVQRTVGEDGQFDSEIDGDQTITGPAALIEVHRPGDGEWQATGVMVGHKADTLTVIDSLPESQLAHKLQTMAAESAADDDTHTNNMSEHETNELVARLEEKESRVDELEAQLSDYEEEIEQVKRAYATALTDATETPLTEDDLVDGFDVATLRERVADIGGDVAEAELSDADVRSGSGDTETEAVALSDEERQRKETLETRLAELPENPDSRYKRNLRAQTEDELAALTGGDN